MTAQCSHQLLYPTPMGCPGGLGPGSPFPVGWTETWTKAAWRGLAVPAHPPNPRDTPWQGGKRRTAFGKQANFGISIIAAGRSATAGNTSVRRGPSGDSWVTPVSAAAGGTWHAPETQCPTPTAPCPPRCALRLLDGHDEAQSPSRIPWPHSAGGLANWFLSAGTHPAPGRARLPSRIPASGLALGPRDHRQAGSSIRPTSRAGKRTSRGEEAGPRLQRGAEPAAAAPQEPLCPQPGVGAAAPSALPCRQRGRCAAYTPGMGSRGPLGPRLCSSRSWAVVLALAAGRPRQSQAPAL